MILTHILGNLSDPDFLKGQEKEIDELPLEYTDAQKHILRAATKQGRDIAIRLSPEAQLAGLHDGDVLMEDGQTLVVIRILPVLALIAKPRSLMEAARFCYEIGDRHAPLYALPEEPPAFAVVYDNSLEILFEKLGISYEKKEISLDDHCRLKLVSGTHHHHHTHHHEKNED